MPLTEDIKGNEVNDMKKILQAIGIITIVAGFCAFVAGILYKLADKHFQLGSLHSSDAASIGIIGGADGPTAVYISNKETLSVFLTAAINLIVSAAALVLRLRKRLRPKR
ncbi:sodium ion-translocating decarboxylase subunit beta [Acetanaerobacterium elongatum]|uniref:Na+-transporting oxaloacetate decarboxylase beta subunit n=1 Tax=Acetanaerobacterium elongatum TaxID=258515 RepID=A0A1G9XZJ9_9FIRM|nr:sodium ion-translocating decarboxylase subunit beta [Acetanaerobacterium elongatum]SDN01851.1 Na+-transporting oxaloacetate decarboxylase beta subunit [Acetanaerobacterium elongatum]